RETKQLLAGYQRVAGTAPTLKTRLEELRRRQAESGVYLRGETDALAAAELQDGVKQTIVSSGGQVRSIQTLPTETRSGFERVTVRVQYTGSMQTLLHVLYELEAHRPLLFVDHLDIRGNIRRTRSRRQRE
ncbi:MAG: general secretion pathway protein, partial [Gammaproteobacteria bacterium]|nr:general secretion pathway protein [Gammaproteobacteria bacterium]